MSDFFHDQLHRRHEIIGELKLETPLRISSGVAGDDTDAPFIRDISGRSYIPGTSLRGAIRSHLERILCGIDPDVSGICSCSLFSENDCARVLREEIKAINEESEEKKRRDRMIRLVEEGICDICRLFGNTMFATRIFFEDCHCKDKPASIIRDGVGIDRDTGAAAPGVKYDYEVIDPGITSPSFPFKATVENATDIDKKIIHLMLQSLTQGIHVGGKRAGGLGRIQLAGDVTVRGFESADTAWRLITNGKFAEDLTSSEITWKEVFPC